MLIDMTTVYNREDYYNAIDENTNFVFLDREIITIKQRNAKELALHQIVSFNLLDCNTPIFYFVDSFTCLFHNDLWFKLRNITYDIVMDRNGNIIPCTEIAQGKC